MANVKRTGELSTSQEEKEIYWKVADLLSFWDKDDDFYLESPKFNFMDREWNLRLYLNGENFKCEDESEGWIVIYLERSDSNSAIKMHCTLEIKEENAPPDIRKELKQTHKGTIEFEEYWDFYFLSRSKFLACKSSLLPYDILTIRCCLKKVNSEFMKDLDLLSEDLGNLHKLNIKPDVTIHVENKKFKSHLSILEARAGTYFPFLVERKTTSESGEMEILVEYCDPDAFEIFLRYLYTGRVENLTLEKALNLYGIARNYNHLKLQSFCVEFMSCHLSADSVSIVARHAKLYNEADLFDSVQDFFNKNVSKVLWTPSWEKFMRTEINLALRLLRAMASTNNIED